MATSSTLKELSNLRICFFLQDEPIYSEIVFVMPDNRGVKGKLFISNFRLYFRSDVSVAIK
jgi:hypothetical protein